MVTRRDYAEEAVRAAKSVLIELFHLLGEYRDNIVLIGGWVPELLFSSQAQEPHVGSIDIDLALDHRRITEAAYKSFEDLLAGRGYKQGDQPYIFYREVILGERVYQVEVDLLAGEYEGTGRSRRHQRIQGIKARKVRGCDLVFDMALEVNVEAELPGGGKDSVTIRVSSVVPFIVMKGIALDERIKEKDAWDIYYCLKNYPGGLDGLIDEFKLYIGRSVVKEGLMKIANHFSSVEHIGPKFVADFYEIADPEERERIQRDAFERVNYFLRGLGMV